MSTERGAAIEGPLLKTLVRACRCDLKYCLAYHPTVRRQYRSPISAHASIVGHRQIEPFSAQKQLTIRSLDDRTLPLQVDGDFIGSATEHSFSVAPRALTVLA